MTARSDLITAYLSYVGETEAPVTFHRWCFISILGAFIGRDYTFKLGHFNIKPNIYCMLMGNAGSRKSTAIKIASKLLSKTGYSTIAADKTTKEKFLLDLSGESDFGKEETDSDSFLEKQLWGETAVGHVPEMLIAADEFNTFVGNGNIEFLSMLGVLWDFEGTFKNKVKNSKSVELIDPFISIIAGNTPTGFSLAFPAEAIGQGIFSRLLLIHGEPTGKRITFPAAPTEAETSQMLDLLHAVRAIAKGNATVSESAKKLLDSIYKTTAPLPDVRFESYMNRRFTHLLKLCLIVSAAALRNTIEEEDVIYANTVLTHAEHMMPKALGEFGKSKHSDVAHKLIQILEHSFEPMAMKDIWMQLHNDLEDISILKDMISNLVIADKIISIKGKFLAKRKVLEEVNSSFVDFSFLTDEERQYIS